LLKEFGNLIITKKLYVKRNIGKYLWTLNETKPHEDTRGNKACPKSDVEDSPELTPKKLYFSGHVNSHSPLSTFERANP
jgi:hypothetical protein